MAERTLHCGVRAGQREARVVMVEGGICPGSGAVALVARLREAGLHVVGVRRALKIFEVATDAGRVGAGQIVIVVHMAEQALHRGVRTRKGEAGYRMVKRGVRPRGRVVALLTSRR